MQLVGTLSECPPLDRLAGPWRELEQRADASFFQSWAWIGTLAATRVPDALFSATRDGRLVGLALLGRRRGRWWDWRTPSLHLNESGDAGLDGVMVEYNGVLAERGLEAAAFVTLLRTLEGWRELHLSAVPPGLAELCDAEGLKTRLLAHHAAPYARFGDQDPLEALSRNARQQVRRSLRLYEERGELALERATPAQAPAWLDDLAEAHTAAWAARGLPGAFGNPWFRPFHRRLIEANPEAVDLLRLSAGGQPIGWLYNFRHRGLAYSYQSGFRYEADERLKPGLVCHVLAMRRYRAEGLAGYRFLAGDSRYKATLATDRDELAWLAVHRDDLGHRLEGWLRRLRRTGGASPGTSAPD